MATLPDPDIIEFMTLYEQVQTATKGKPERIVFLYKNDQKFAELCRQIDLRVSLLNLQIRDSGDTVLENVDPRFIAKWRHYQNELDRYIGRLAARDLFAGLLIGKNDVPFETSASNEHDELKYEVKEEYDAIQLRLELGSWERVSASTVDEEVSDKVYEGERALDKILTSIGLLNLPNALYRQRMLSAVHIPTHVSAGNMDHAIALVEALKEAHRVFILGAPLAAIALCRTVSEIIIRDHYRIGDESTGFTERFDKARKDPIASRKGADEDLVQLVKYASNILHGRKTDERISTEQGIEVMPSDLETINRVAFRWLEKLVKLIEATPKR